MFEYCRFYFSEISNAYKVYKRLVRVFLFVRWLWTPYLKFAGYMPDSGTVLDLGCGHGLFSLAVAAKKKGVSVTAVDHDRERMKWAFGKSECPRNVLPVSSTIEDYLFDARQRGKKYSAIAIIDVLHYFDYETQNALVEKALELLEDSGVFLMREINPDYGISSKINYVYEKVATGIGFTKGKHVFVRRVEEWKRALSGFKEVQAFSCTKPPFSDFLYICRK